MDQGKREHWAALHRSAELAQEFLPANRMDPYSVFAELLLAHLLLAVLLPARLPAPQQRWVVSSQASAGQEWGSP